MAIHNEAKIGEIAENVLMPGDPLRAKYIAENFLEDYKLVNTVRNVFAFTGKYKGKEVTVMASGMGMPSIGIYSYELYKEYNVKNIVRIGSCGAYTEELDLMDVVLVNNSYNEGNFAYNMTGVECHDMPATESLNKIIKETAENINQKIVVANIASTECFDPYLEDPMMYANRLPKDKNIAGSEMEAFALFYTAKVLNRNAACLLTVVDSNVKKQNLTSEQRLKSLNEMIVLALESTLRM